MVLTRIDGPAKVTKSSVEGGGGKEEEETLFVGAGATGRASAARVLGEAEDAAASTAVELRGGGLLTCEAFAFRIP